jgi:hypothetical protein
LRPARVQAQGREGRGFRWGGCGLRAGDRTAFVREGGDVGRGHPCPQPKRLRLVVPE